MLKLFLFVSTCSYMLWWSGAGRALEVFMNKLCEGSAAIALDKQARTLTTAHLCVPPAHVPTSGNACSGVPNVPFYLAPDNSLTHTRQQSASLTPAWPFCDRKAYVYKEPMMDFLKPKLASAPDLAADDVPGNHAKPKRQR